MASGEDKKGYWNFTTGNPKQVVFLIVSFCQKNDIVCSQFECWYKNRHKVEVYAVDIVDIDGVIPVQKTKMSKTCGKTIEVVKTKEYQETESTLFTIQIKSTFASISTVCGMSEGKSFVRRTDKTPQKSILYYFAKYIILLAQVYYITLPSSLYYFVKYLFLVVERLPLRGASHSKIC